MNVLEFTNLIFSQTIHPTSSHALHTLVRNMQINIVFCMYLHIAVDYCATTS